MLVLRLTFHTKLHDAAANFGGGADERLPLSWMSANDCRPGSELR